MLLVLFLWWQWRVDGQRRVKGLDRGFACKYGSTVVIIAVVIVVLAVGVWWCFCIGVADRRGHLHLHRADRAWRFAHATFPHLNGDRAVWQTAVHVVWTW